MQYLLEREELERFQEEEEKRQAQENEKQWLKREKEAQENWGELQKQFEIINEEKLQEEQRLLQEWKKEQEKIVKEKKRLKRIQEENEERQQRIEQRIAEYIEEGGELPEELRVSMETNPNREPCPFFQKTGACRFKDTCSRNHIRPSASSVLLFPNFYTHFHLSVKENEYGSDQSLELDDRELYKHFREFYHDVLPEMEKYGRVVQFKACQNTELHLRGNVYVEYARTRDALKSYKVFQGRFYAGKQVNVEFCNVASWKAAICGEFRCLKSAHRISFLIQQVYGTTTVVRRGSYVISCTSSQIPRTASKRLTAICINLRRKRTNKFYCKHCKLFC